MGKVVKLKHPPEPWIVTLANSLVGTAGMTEPPELENMTTEQCRQFDSLVFCCEGCGWWHSADECNEDGGWYCDECMGDKLGSL